MRICQGGGLGVKHGRYVNPGDSGFRRILNSEYVDKTGLIEQINKRINSTEGLVCVSRPRRFGKSFAAQMLSAYYDRSCDSRALFDNKRIAESEGYSVHLNQYNVVCFDVTSFISVTKRLRKPISDVTNTIVNALHKELVEMYPYLADEKTLTDCFLRCTEKERHLYSL